MAWQNLKEDLEEEFGVTESHTTMLQALDIRLSARKSYQNAWDRIYRVRSLETQAKNRERARARARETYVPTPRKAYGPREPTKLEQALALLKTGNTIREAAKAVGLSHMTVWRHSK